MPVGEWLLNILFFVEGGGGRGVGLPLKSVKNVALLKDYFFLVSGFVLKWPTAVASRPARLFQQIYGPYA